MSEVIVLSSSYQPVGKASIEKAICYIYLGKAYSIKDSDRVVRSINETIPIPIAIVIPDARFYKKNEITFTKQNVYKRDGYACVYCGDRERKNLTLDHVTPKDRWKDLSKKLHLTYTVNSFENCVTACRNCNQKKSNKLLSELGWPEQNPQKPLSVIDVDWDALLD